MSATATRIDPATLAGLVAARMCHDLVSPLGAIGNGIELMEMAGPAAGQSGELALVHESLAAARARINAFRTAFGTAGGDQRLGRADLEALLRDVTAGGRLRVELEAAGDVSRVEAKLLLLALMCIETALPWGGRVLVCRATGGWRLVAEAPRTRADPGLWSWLGGGDAALAPPAPTPAEVQFPLLAAEAALRRRSLRWEVDETGAEIAL